MKPPNTPSSEILDRCDTEISLPEILGILLRGKWLVLGPSLFCTLIVVLFVMQKPNLYQSEALILISPPIVNPDSKVSGEGANLSEITTNSLEASTYEVLAKSDELMIALADTIKQRLATTQLSKTFSDTDTYTLATNLKADLNTELLQETGQVNKQSTTPILVLSYASSKAEIPILVVNTWAELFLQRNQGLSSNITDDFYQSVVRQYEQAKLNLESKEDELVKIEATSNDLNRFKTELTIKNSLLDSALIKYKNTENQIISKKMLLEQTNSFLNQVELNGVWIGYLSDTQVVDKETTGSLAKKIGAVKNEIKSLYSDSLQLALDAKNDSILLGSTHRSTLLNIEQDTQQELKELQVRIFRSTIEKYQREKIELPMILDSLKLQESVVKQSLSELKPVIITHKAIVDEALWSNVVSGTQVNVDRQQKLSNFSLVTEEIDPIYTKLREDLTRVTKHTRYVTERQDFLNQEIENLQFESTRIIDELLPIRREKFLVEKRLTDEKAELTKILLQAFLDNDLKLQLSRELFDNYKIQYERAKVVSQELERELSELASKVEYQSNNYDSWREQIKSLSIRVDSLNAVRSRINREIEVYTESFNKFSRLREQARVARQQAAGDIQIVSKAKIPELVPKDILYTSVFAMLSCVIIFSFLLLLRHVLKNNF